LRRAHSFPTIGLVRRPLWPNVARHSEGE
jgi:hypothetical protein